MPLLRWNPEFSIKNEELDQHHQRLFYLLNSAYDSVMESAETHRINTIIEELSDYTNYHFCSEEEHMRQTHFHAIDDHIAQHREFAHTIEMLRSRSHDNDLDVARDLIIVLGEWLLGHVLKDDMGYSELSRSDAK